MELAYSSPTVTSTTIQSPELEVSLVINLVSVVNVVAVAVVAIAVVGGLVVYVN